MKQGKRTSHSFKCFCSFFCWYKRGTVKSFIFKRDVCVHNYCFPILIPHEQEKLNYNTSQEHATFLFSTTVRNFLNKILIQSFMISIKITIITQLRFCYDLNQQVHHKKFQTWTSYFIILILNTRYGPKLMYRVVPEFSKIHEV